MDGAQGFNYSFNTISASILLEYYCAVIFFFYILWGKTWK